MKNVLLEKKFIEKYLKTVNRICDSCILRIEEDNISSISSTPDNVVILYIKGKLPSNTNFTDKINIIDIKRFLCGLDCLDSNEIEIQLNENYIKCLSKNSEDNTHFKYHLVDDSVMTKSTFSAKKIAQLTFDTEFKIPVYCQKKIIAGSPGIELMTKGKLVLNCGSLEILTSDGEMVVGSTNKTTIKGKVVCIDAEDGSNTGGINMNAPNTLIKGLSVSGNAAIKGALKVEGELSCKYINTVGQRLQSDMAGSPDQRIPFSNWAVGSCQTNDILNSIRTAITHYLMPGAILTITNIVKFVMQCYNTILTNTIMEYAPTGLFFGLYAGPIYNWHHNQLEDPKPIHVDYITPKGVYFDDGSGVDSNSVDPGPVPTRARKNGMGMDGGPKTLAGCGGFGNWGGGVGGTKKGRLNSFGLGDVEGFTGTRIRDKNVKYEFNKDGTIKFKLDPTPCD